MKVENLFFKHTLNLQDYVYNHIFETYIMITGRPVRDSSIFI